MTDSEDLTQELAEGLQPDSLDTWPSLKPTQVTLVLVTPVKQVPFRGSLDLVTLVRELLMVTPMVEVP